MKVWSRGGLPSRKFDVDELCALYVEYRSTLVARAARSLRDRSLAEEVTQDALVKLILAAPELKNRNHTLAYLSRTVDSLCIDIFRREGRRPSLVLLDDNLDLQEEALQDRRDLLDIVGKADDAAIVRNALSLLSPAERAALVMWEIEGRSTEEIARELGIKAASVRHTVSRARASLKRILSERVIDETNGLTALDLLTHSYRKSSRVIRGSARVTLSIFILLFSYIGLVEISSIKTSKFAIPVTESLGKEKISFEGQGKIPGSYTIAGETNSLKTKVLDRNLNLAKHVYSKADSLWFAGLDNYGVPTGFTITDSTEQMGSLYIYGKEASVLDDGLRIASIAKTLSGAANLFVNQTIWQDVTGITFTPSISYGREGTWIPLKSQVISTDVVRLRDGNFLLTAVSQVQSEWSTSIRIEAHGGGRDLQFAPSRVLFRVVLNSSKTQILGEAIQVVEGI